MAFPRTQFWLTTGILHTIVSVATQVAISRRVQRYKLALRGRQDAENRRTSSTSNQSTPMICGWSVDAS
ncbi:unnamed protein product [Ectocarpus sp. CCAP 1310/34]|nr:unnamed protein product [Ectocarpus sp. CCAP 1310/34]